MNQNEELFKLYSRMDMLQKRVGLLPNADLYQEALGALAGAMTRLASPDIRVTVAGEFNRGKSMLVNALAGREVSPVSSRPMTRHDILIRNGSEERYVLDLGQGEAEVSRETFEATLLNGNSQVRAASLQLPEFAPGTRINLVDTYGLNDGEVESLASIFCSDVLVWVLVPDSPISQSEAAALKQWANRPHGRLILAVNKIDQLDAERGEVERLISAVRERMEKLSLPNGALSGIFPISARAAREAQLRGAPTTDSGLPRLWNAILMEACPAMLAHRIAQGRAELGRCREGIRETMDAQRQSMSAALQAMDDARTQLDEVLGNMSDALRGELARVFAFDGCICPEEGLSRMKDVVESAAASAPIGMRYAKDAAAMIASRGRAAAGNILDKADVNQASARERLSVAMSRYMSAALRDLEALDDPVNATLLRVGRDIPPVRTDHYTALASQRLSLEMNMPRLSVRFDEFQLSAMMVMGKNAMTGRLTAKAESAFARWRDEWNVVLQSGDDALKQWGDALLAADREALSTSLMEAEQRLRSDLDALASAEPKITAMDDR